MLVQVGEQVDVIPDGRTIPCREGEEVRAGEAVVGVVVVRELQRTCTVVCVIIYLRVIVCAAIRVTVCAAIRLSPVECM